jgi:hypothetical protein
LRELSAQLANEDAFLFGELQLAKLVAEEAEGGAGGKGGEANIAETYQVIVECADEPSQKKAFEQLKQQGLTVKLLTI